MSSEIVNTPPKLIADYRFLKIIGEGSSGKTFLAVRRNNSEHVAIKVLKTYSTYKGMELFEREAKTLSEVHVSGIPHFYEYIRSDGMNGEAYLIQEYIKYPSLQTYIDNGRVFTEREVVGIMQAIAEIIGHLQMDFTPAIMHRDIKPSNILYDEKSGKCYLIDFGAVANPLKKTMGSTVAGTMGFMAPEQLMGDCTIQSDYYALGATALNLLLRVPPYYIEHDENDPFVLKFETPLAGVVSAEMIHLLMSVTTRIAGERMHAVFLKNLLYRI